MTTTRIISHKRYACSVPWYLYNDILIHMTLAHHLQNSTRAVLVDQVEVYVMSSSQIIIVQLGKRKGENDAATHPSLLGIRRIQSQLLLYLC